ncbi:MAG: fatty acyl-AMP ligase [Gemmatimonadetes bacterium]|nr:fatty acyl-AMP ligase [Gemmatimonadota bacterium]MBI4543164.1 fatty acyl-AMP ligase [Gemmatimonadota bacterium]
MSAAFRSLVDLLRFRAGVEPHARAYTFLVNGETEGASLTYGELDERARATAAMLQESGVAPGDRALLLYPPGLDFMSAFFGSLYAGAVAVPAYPPNPPHPSRGLPRLLAVLGEAGVRVVLSTEAVAAGLPALAPHAPELAALPWLATDRLAAGAADSWRDPGIGPRALAFLQFTSGSTASPRGVMVGHGNLLHNLAYANHLAENDATSVSLSWLPVIHDMGLIEGVLQPLYAGFPAYLMAPNSFLQRPLRWLQAISRYRVTNSGGPNFAYDLCVRKVAPEQRAALDLSSWRMAFNGAEPIRRDTLRAFHDAFRGCGFRWSAFYPVYGLAEATLLVSSGGRDYEPVIAELDAGELARGVVAHQNGGRTAALVASGRLGFGTRVEIVDPATRTRAAPGRIGEIWIASPSVAHGYWERPEETERTFRAYLADTGEGPFLRTGDLGFLADGELFIAGRLKDVLIVRGAKHFPQDIELDVERRHPAIRPGCSAAFSCDDGEAERVVVAAEVDPRALRRAAPAALVEEVVLAVREGVAAEHGIQLHAVALLGLGGVPRTSSGKVRRTACRAAFLAGTLDEVARWSVKDGFLFRTAGRETTARAAG